MKNKEIDRLKEALAVEELDLNKINVLPSTKIDTMRVEKEIALQKVLDVIAIVKTHKSTLQMEILNMKTRLAKKQEELAGIKATLEKGDHIKEKMTNQLSILKSKFWAARNSGT
jgi:hypothetical protein